MKGTTGRRQISSHKYVLSSCVRIWSNIWFCKYPYYSTFTERNDQALRKVTTLPDQNE